MMNLTISSNTRSTGTSTTPGQSRKEECLKKQSAMLHSRNSYQYQKIIQKTEKQTISYHALAARSGVADSMETPLMAATGDAGHDRQQVGSQVACQHTVFFAILYFCMLFK